MTEADEPEFVRIVAAIAVQKPGKPLTSDAMALFWLSMQGWSIEDFRAAAAHLSRTVEFMPNAYHFDQLRKASLPTPGEAFQRARQIVRRLNPREYTGHDSGDARLDAAVSACGGYGALAMCTSENIGFFERRFAEHFEAITDAETVRASLPQLTGGARLGGPRSVAALLERFDARP